MRSGVVMRLILRAASSRGSPSESRKLLSLRSLRITDLPLLSPRAHMGSIVQQVGGIASVDPPPPNRPPVSPIINQSDITDSRQHKREPESDPK